MERKVISYASTTKSAVNIIEADGFRIKGGDIIGLAEGETRDIRLIPFSSTTKGEENILEADGFQIKDAIETPSLVKKMPYKAPKIETDTMKDSQKYTVRDFNEMQAMLIKHNLMEKK